MDLFYFENRRYCHTCAAYGIFLEMRTYIMGETVRVVQKRKIRLRIQYDSNKISPTRQQSQWQRPRKRVEKTENNNILLYRRPYYKGLALQRGLYRIPYTFSFVQKQWKTCSKKIPLVFCAGQFLLQNTESQCRTYFPTIKLRL